MTCYSAVIFAYTSQAENIAHIIPVAPDNIGERKEFLQPGVS
jgi:hypothetical protein